jgi:SAM-dependent methyltransferase
MELIITIIAVLIFVTLVATSIYIIFLFINSRGFKISPTITSDGKSIKKMATYIEKYNQDNLKKLNLKILDIGSGYGKLLFRMNKMLNNRGNIFVGYEISKFSYKVSKILNKSKNIYLIRDDINNLKDTDFDFVISFMLEKQQKIFISVFKKFPKGTIILANSNNIPFEESDGFKMIDKINVHFGWDIFVWKKIR